MPLRQDNCSDFIHVSLTLWLNFIIHGCKKRNVLYEKISRLQNQNKKWGVGNKMQYKKKKWTTVVLQEKYAV